MSRRTKNDPKLERLRALNALHPHPEAVTDPDFCCGGFFDPRDFVQVKYEMLRRTRVEAVPASRAAAAFGLSRVSFYDARRRLEREGLAGLLPRKRGPRRAHKLDGEVVQALLAALEQDPSLGPEQLARLVQERFGKKVHPRSVERALGRAKKKRL